METDNQASVKHAGEPLLVVQLFNGRSPSKAARPLPRHNTHPALEAVGIKTEVVHPFRWPWNPFANMHNAYRGLDPLRAIYVMLKYRKADLICAHLESAAIILLFRSLFVFHVPVLIWEVPWSPGWRYRDVLSGIAIPRADMNVVFGSNQIQLLRDRYGDSIPVEPILFSVDTDYYRPVPSSSKPDRPVIWSCGLDTGRDFGLLVDATKGIDATLRIRGPSDLALDDSSNPNLIIEKRFLPKDEFRRAYADAAVVVVCTKNTPNAAGVTSLMEALAMGRPTIVSDNPSLRDYFPPSDAVIVVPVGDADALRNAINWVLQNPVEAEEMGLKARRFAEVNYSAARHFKAMGQIFLRTLTRKKSSISQVIS